MDEERMKKLKALKKKKRMEQLEAMGEKHKEEEVEEEELAETEEKPEEKKIRVEKEDKATEEIKEKEEAEAAEETKGEREESPKPKASKWTPPSDGTDKPGRDYLGKAGNYGDQALVYLKGMDLKRSRIIFLTGVMIVLFVAFIQHSKQKSLSALRAQKESLDVAYKMPIKPVAPASPLRPQLSWYEKGAESETYKEAKKFYTEEIKAYEKSKEAYDKQLFSWKKARDNWEYNTAKLKSERLPYLQWKIAVQRASLDSWAYLYYLVRMAGVFLMAFGCMVFLLVGSDAERAAAIFVLGFVLLQLA